MCPIEDETTKNNNDKNKKQEHKKLTKLIKEKKKVRQIYFTADAVTDCGLVTPERERG